MSSLRRYFPNQITSPETNDYNCIAWAAEDDKRWWEPDIWRIYYWPRKAPRLMTLDAYIKAYETIGYIVCQDGNWEDGYIKIALFVDDQNIPTHAARLLSNDRWTSKCGGFGRYRTRVDRSIWTTAILWKYCLLYEKTYLIIAGKMDLAFYLILLRLKELIFIRYFKIRPAQPSL